MLGDGPALSIGVTSLAPNVTHCPMMPSVVSINIDKNNIFYTYDEAMLIVIMNICLY